MADGGTKYDTGKVRLDLIAFLIAYEQRGVGEDTRGNTD